MSTVDSQIGGDAAFAALCFIFVKMSQTAIIFAEITILFMEVVDMMLNLMIVGLMILAIAIGGCSVAIDERRKEEKKIRVIEGTWDRL